jgi:hypothetical protein
MFETTTEERKKHKRHKNIKTQSDEIFSHTQYFLSIQMLVNKDLQLRHISISNKIINMLNMQRNAATFFLTSTSTSFIVLDCVYMIF